MLKYILDDKTAPAIARLGERVFDITETANAMDGAKNAIAALSDFCFKTLKLKGTLTDLNINDEHFKDMAKHACFGGEISGPKNLSPDDLEKIYRMCL